MATSETNKRGVAAFNLETGEPMRVDEKDIEPREMEEVLRDVVVKSAKCWLHNREQIGNGYLCDSTGVIESNGAIDNAALTALLQSLFSVFKENFQNTIGTALFLSHDEIADLAEDEQITVQIERQDAGHLVWFDFHKGWGETEL